MLYLDTSALIKLLVAEDGTAETQEAVSTAAGVASSALTYAEARAALARMRAGGRIDRSGQRAARADLDALWLDVASIPAEDQLLASAADLADRHSLRGYDAIQLAAAVSLNEATEVALACWDADLRAAARAEGLAVAIG